MSNWPQYAYLAMVLIGLGVSMANHGESKGEENFFVTAARTALAVFLLWQGGFFRNL